MKSITLKNITHTYGKHTVLHDVTLSLPIGKMIAICGPSGCGKTTLLNIIGLLERPSRGSVQYDEMEVCANSSRAVKKLRYTIGFLFQNYGLSDNDTVLWNMMSAMEYVKTGKEEKKKCIAQVLEKVGLYGIEQQKICQLSGGKERRLLWLRMILCLRSVVMRSFYWKNTYKKLEAVILKIGICLQFSYILLLW